MKVLLNNDNLSITIKRLVHQVLENEGLENTVFIGLQPRGVFFADQLIQYMRQQYGDKEIVYGALDITFYRDDVRKELHKANATNILFSVEGKRVVLIDDVLFTGRTIRAALDALLDFGRPSKVELCVLIDRRFSRQFPIQPDYVGKAIDAFISQKVKVNWAAEDGIDEVILLDD